MRRRAERSRFFAALADHSGPLVVALRRPAGRCGRPSRLRGARRTWPVPAQGDGRGRSARPSRDRRGAPDCSNRVWSICSSATSKESPGRCRCRTLLQTWAHREGRTLTVAGYHASGGIRGAVAQSAELVYEKAAPGQRPLLRDLMLRLVTPSPEGEPVRSRIPRRVVATDPDHEQVIELLVDARLVTSDEEMVELAHEALARAWPLRKAGSTTTPTANASCVTSPSPPTRGTRWAGPTPSCTGASG